MQTPQNEERNPKRTKEEPSRSGRGTSNIQYETSHSKRPRLNPVSEQEHTEGLVEITDTELDISKGIALSEETQGPST